MQRLTLGLAGAGGALEQQSDFFSDDCGKAALQLCARGNVIIAELLRLSDCVPDPFKDPANSEYAGILCDFSYFRQQEAFDAKVKSSPELRERDSTFYQTHAEVLEGFFDLFKSIKDYVLDVNQYVSFIEEGFYVSNTIQSVLETREGAQLLGEMHYLYGVMLLLMDEKIGGAVRERIIVSHVRYQGAAADPQTTIDIARLLCMARQGQKMAQPVGYPTAYFARLPVNTKVVQSIVERFREDRVYEMAEQYTSSQQRCIALSSQAAVLYILLFFVPRVLDENPVTMQDIVERFFADNWVVHYYNGFTADLSRTWRSFACARRALSARTLQLPSVRFNRKNMWHSLCESQNRIVDYLREGVLTEEFFLNHIFSDIIPAVRDTNVALRWFILHGTVHHAPADRHSDDDDEDANHSKWEREHEQEEKVEGENEAGDDDGDVMAEIYAAVGYKVSNDDLIRSLLRTAELEYSLLTLLNRFLPLRQSRWREAREQAVDRMNKISHFFADQQNFVHAESADEQLCDWFAEMAELIGSVSFRGEKEARLKLQKLVKALEDVEEFHQVDNNLHVRLLLQQAEQLLKQMIHCLVVDDRVLLTLGTITDFSYAWGKIASGNLFVPEIQAKLKRDPGVAVQMRSVFAKLSSVLDTPCRRIEQTCQQDARFASALTRVSGFYSNALVALMQRVLHVIPISIFEKLRMVIQLLTSELKECATRVHRKDLKDVSQLGERERLSGYTADIARYANGILAMEHTLVGVVSIDSHKLLTDGIRRELVDQVTRELHVGLVFDGRQPCTSAETLESELRLLGQRLQGMKCAFEYIQDFIFVNGHRIWLEELTRIFAFNVDMESNFFAQKKMYSMWSSHQSARIPIPYFETRRSTAPGGSSGGAYSFLGNFVQHLLFLTDPCRATYVPCLRGWVTRASIDDEGDDDVVEEVVATRTFKIFANATGSIGLAALDKLLCFIIARDLQVALHFVASLPPAVKEGLMEVERQLSPVASTPPDAGAHYFELLHLLKEDDDAPAVAGWTETLCRIGRLQLMRRLVAMELCCDAQLHSGSLYSSLHTLNASFLYDLASHAQENAKPDGETSAGAFVGAISPFLERVGITDVFAKVYSHPASHPALPELPLVAFTALLGLAPHVRYDADLSCCVPSLAQDIIDPVCAMAGFVIVFAQLHPSYRTHFLELLVQATRVSVCTFVEADGESRANAKEEVLPALAEVLTKLLYIFVEFSERDMGPAWNALAQVQPLTQTNF